MTYSIFTRKQRGKPRTMHAVRVGERATVCGLPIGVGTGLVRDGDYATPHVACPSCWRRS